MNKYVELPIMDPMYGTYHNGIASAVLYNNQSIRNWYLNQVMILCCDKKFLTGFTTPNIHIIDMHFWDNPHLEKIWFPMKFANGYINIIIRNMIDQGYYVYFSGIDDYYVEGKSWHNVRHFNHDGAICGYDQENKKYCIYAYDKNWIYRKFWSSQKSFDLGRKSMFKRGYQGKICAIKPLNTKVEFSVRIAYKKILEYLDSDMRKYPENSDGNVYGIVVHDYIAKYIDRLYDGSIPYEHMDWRVFRLLWEHKKVMLERIVVIEKKLDLDNTLSELYKAIVKEADNIRMFYASYCMKRRDSILLIISKKLLTIEAREREILTQLLQVMKEDIEDGTLEASKK